MAFVIDSISTNALAANAFTIETLTLPYPAEHVADAVTMAFKESNEGGVVFDPSRRIISTAASRHGIIGFPYFTRYAVVLRTAGADSTLMSYKLMNYDAHLEGNNQWVLTPVVSQDANAKRRKDFLDRLWKALRAER